MGTGFEVYGIGRVPDLGLGMLDITGSHGFPTSRPKIPPSLALTLKPKP